MSSLLYHTRKAALAGAILRDVLTALIIVFAMAFLAAGVERGSVIRMSFTTGAQIGNTLSAQYRPVNS